MFIKLLTILSLCLLAIAYPTGAPEGSCSLRIPGHSAEPQTTPAPFNIEVKSIAGGKYSVTIKSTDSGVFKGYLLAAIDSSKNYIGNFTHGANIKQLACPQGNAVTHSEHAGKTSVRVDWLPPTTFKGLVQFTATVVRDFTTFWVDVKTPLTI